MSLKKKVKNLKIPVLFINNGLFISQEKSFNKMNAYLFCSYNIISFLLEQFDLIIKYRKTEVFYFFRSYSFFNLFLLDLSYIRDLILHPKDLWKYLRFIFDRKLIFHQHIRFYANKALYYKINYLLICDI